MIIQFNTDKTINGNQRQRDYFATLIEEELERHSTHITRVEIHLSDENGIKEGSNDIRCLLEARLRGRKPIVVVDQSDTIEHAMAGAIEKLKASLESIMDRISDHRKT
ncbi:MAG: HPF/RaiA family ribosome-associated protein [Cyclobacteriaceae bacterium]|nr:HPF/RaiA family ribosome-associated protein [Cyclobacteriaceae bacterium]